MNRIKIQAKKYFIFLLCFIIITGWLPWQTKNLYGYAAEQNQIVPSVTHDYVTDISFPQTTSIPQNIQGYTFSPQQGDYDIMLLDSRKTAFSISISDKYFGNNAKAQLGYNVYIDGEIQQTTPQSLSKETTSCVRAAPLLNTNKFKVGEKHILSIKVGELTKNKDGYVDDQYDVYNFNITRGLTLKKLSAEDEKGVPCIITPNMSAKNADPYENTYGMVCSGANAVLKLEATTTGTTITVNGQELTAGETTIENWKQYVKTGEHFADIPIQLDYNVGNAKAESRIYTLRITEQNYQPVITKHPGSMRVEKQAQNPLSVEVSTPEVGVLSYQWYRSVRKNNSLSDYKKIKGATESCYQPDSKYARSLFYYCKVTNTVGSVKYTVDSAVAEVTTIKTYLTAPEFITQPTVTQSGSRIFYKNGVPDIEVGVIKPFNSSAGINYIEGDEYQFTVYRNSVDSFDGAEQIDANFNMFTTQERTEPSTGEQYCVYKATLAPQDITGNWYYFVKVTVAKSGFKDASCISNSLKLTFKDTTDVVKKLEGSGTKNDPFLVYNEKDLLYVKSLVEGKDGDAFSFSGQIIAFANDIELSKEWSPIGNIKAGGDERDRGKSLQPFSGTIDGQNHTLVVADHGKSLLNYARKATVKNLNIKGEHIDGYGLLERYVVDYGPNGIYENNPVRLRVIDVENVTIKAGTKILESGFLGGYASGANACNIRNCKVEAGVIIGYDKTKTKIGSFAGDFNGTLENCISYATVYGVDCVGGLLGTKGQSMGTFVAVNSAFLGSIEASGKVVGGIAGGGYIAVSAPGTPTAEIHNCYVDAQISAGDQVGGIIGSEAGHHTYNDTGDIYGVKGALSISDNIFVGKIKSSGSYIGGIIGCVYDFTKNSGVATNYYLDNCGAKSGIGGAISGKVTGAERHSALATAEEFANGTILDKLNQSDSSYKNWIQGGKYPIISEKNVVTGISIDGEYQNQYTIGEKLNLEGSTIYVFWSDGSKVPLSGDEMKRVEILGYNPNAYGTQNVILKYGGAKTEITVTVLKPDTPDNPKMMTVSFTLLGDIFHKSDEDKTVHTLENNNLQLWFEDEYTVSINATVKDVFEKALTEAHYTWRNESGNYVQGITRPENGKELAEFTNGPSSGWMYTLNGVHPQWGVAEQYLEPNDKIIFHYTDNYFYEPDTKEWVGATDEVKDVTTSGAAGSATTTAPTEVKVSGTTATATVKAENQSEILKQAAEKKSAEIILEVSKADSKGADSVQLSLDVTFVKNVADKTNADLTVNTENGKVTLDQETLKTIIGEAKGNTVIIEITKVTKPTEAQKKAAGANGHLLKLTIKSGDKVISDFNKGKVKVVAEIVSKLLDKKVAAIHIADDGKIEQLAGKVLTIGGKKFYEFTTPHFSTFALVDADELGLDVAEEPTVDAKALTAKLTPIARSAKTAKKNVKVTVSLDKQDKAIIKELKDAGCTVKYRFYRSTKKAAGYKAAVTKKTAAYTNTGGKKGTKYFYKVQVRVYDENGMLTAKTALKQCKYASRIWAKAN